MGKKLKLHQKVEVDGREGRVHDINSDTWAVEIRDKATAETTTFTQSQITKLMKNGVVKAIQKRTNRTAPANRRKT